MNKQIQTFQKTSIGVAAKFLVALSIGTLAACGGGGDDVAQESTSSSPPITVPIPIDRTNGCAAKTVDDMWLDKRLDCFSAGQIILNTSTGAQDGTSADYSFTLNQTISDELIRDTSLINKRRYFARILCVKNAPKNLTTSSLYRVGLATDILVAMRELGATPDGYRSYMGAYGEDSLVQEPCDIEKHPLIVDFSTRKIVSVSMSAMSKVKVYDLYD